MYRTKITLLLAAMLLMTLQVIAKERFTLVIDAGHGGHDAGAIGAVAKEKNINLNVALAFGRLVEQNCPDVRVIYTRKTDVFIPLHTRADIANRNKADLFISIHTNSLPAGRIARGMETYTLGMHRANDNLEVAKRENSVILVEKDYKQRYQGFDPRSSESYIMFELMQDKNMAQSVELAKFVQRRTCATANRPDKGVKQAGFLVLRETSMPSCLIELGFISTADEERFLNSTEGVDKLGQGIYQAFLDYKKKVGALTETPTPSAVAQTPEPPVQETPMQEMPKQETSRQEDPRQTATSQQQTVSQQKNPGPKEKNLQQGKNKKHRQVMQELADARAGKVTDTQATLEVSADSILQAVAQMTNTRSAQTEAPKPAPAAANKPAQTETPKPAPAAATKPEKEVETVKKEVETVKKDAETVKKEVETVKIGAPSGTVFKVQILASSTRLKPTSPQLKGQKDADYYQEGGLYKYTVGASADYNQIYQLRKTLLESFPQAFVIAFKDGKRTDVQQAIQEYKQNKNKR